MDWRPISTAPRDGTEIELTWLENGRAQEVYPMRWEPETQNRLVQDHPGIWALRNRLTGDVVFTWSESDPDGAPTHWRPIYIQ